MALQEIRNSPLSMEQIRTLAWEAAPRLGPLVSIEPAPGTTFDELAHMTTRFLVKHPDILLTMISEADGITLEEARTLGFFRRQFRFCDIVSRTQAALGADAIFAAVISELALWSAYSTEGAR